MNSVSVDWTSEARLEVLLRLPEVQALIRPFLDQAQRPLSGEDLIKYSDLIFKPAVGVSLKQVRRWSLPLTSSLGIKTGQQRSQVFASPIGRTLVAMVCSLARHSQTLREICQAETGCRIEASLPSDWRSFEGSLWVRVLARAEGTLVEAATRIDGQIYDWGKSRRCLDELFADITALNFGSLSPDRAPGPVMHRDSSPSGFV